MVFVASQVGVAMAAKKKNEIAFGVSMKANVGSKIGKRIPITDPDGDKLTFSITEGNEEGFFTIDSETGQLSLAAALDGAPKEPKLRLSILASDGNGGDVNVVVIVYVYQGTCHVCATILESIHKELERQYENAAGNDLQLKHLFKTSNITQIAETICDDPTSVLSSKKYYPACQKIAVGQAKIVGAAFKGKKRQATFGGDHPKKTFSRILDLCSATMGLCDSPTDTDAKRYETVRKDRCQKCISTVEDLELQSTRWRQKAAAKAAEQAGKDPNAMAVIELRAELKSKQLTTKGLRPDLIKRLVKARAEEFLVKGSQKKTRRILNRGQLENLLETSCGDMGFRHAPSLASSMGHLCEELTEDFMDEISEFLIKDSEKHEVEDDLITTGDLSRYVCGPKLASLCTEKNMNDYMPGRYFSPFADADALAGPQDEKKEL